MLNLLTNPLAIGLLAFLAFLIIFPLIFQDKSAVRKNKVLEEISKQNTGATPEGSGTILREYRMSESIITQKLLEGIPGIPRLHQLILKAGISMSLMKFLLVILVVMLILSVIALKIMGPLGILVGSFFGLLLPIKLLQRKIRRRNDQFINMFADAIDMIVRSVRSGHPLNASLRMIAENMDPPVSTEFKQVVDEIAYGRTLPEAMFRMSQRIGESDLKFFVVVLSVQQETGGNLAEVLSNLSNIIRKRKQLRLKIKALTAEGRMTMWILGSLPFFEFAILWIMNKEYLMPLFNTAPGQVIFWAACTMVGICFWIINKMINIDI